MAQLVSERYRVAGRGRHCKAGIGDARNGTAWPALQGWAWSCTVRLSQAWPAGLCKGWLGRVRQGVARQARPGEAQCGIAQTGAAGRAFAWTGAAEFVKARHGRRG